MHPEKFLSEANNANPGAWAKIDAMRQSLKSKWPAHIFLPQAGAASAYRATTTATTENDTDSSSDIDLFLTIASWRTSQGVYQFSPEAEGQLWGSALDPRADFFFSDLKRLPEWAPYVRLNQPRIGLMGFFLVPTYNAGDEELVVVLDHEAGLLPVHLRPTDLGDDILESADHWLDQFEGDEADAERYENILFGIMPLILGLLYCSPDRLVPGNQSAVKCGTPKRGGAVVNRDGDERMFPPSRPRLWLIQDEEKGNS